MATKKGAVSKLLKKRSNKIRPIQPKKDLERVAEIWLKVSICEHDFVPDPDKFWPERLPNLKKETCAAKGYVYEEKGLIQGFVTMTDRYIFELFVDSECRQKGIGSILLNEAKKNRSFLALHVYKQRPTIIQWYEKRGFVKTGTVIREECTGQEKFKMVWNREKQ